LEDLEHILDSSRDNRGPSPQIQQVCGLLQESGAFGASIDQRRTQILKPHKQGEGRDAATGTHIK
jgi:hypothetical protein